MPLGGNHSGAPQKLLNACGLPHGTTTFIWNNSTLVISNFLCAVYVLHSHANFLPRKQAGNLVWHIRHSSRRQLVREVSFVWMNHLISFSRAAHPVIFTALCNWPLCFPSVACFHSLSYSLCCPAHPRHQWHKGLCVFANKGQQKQDQIELIKVDKHPPAVSLYLCLLSVSCKCGCHLFPQRKVSPFLLRTFPFHILALGNGSDCQCYLPFSNSSTIYHSVFCLSFFLQTKSCGLTYVPLKNLFPL